jgi:propanol-preferring alcohol dehydrogenase
MLADIPRTQRAAVVQNPGKDYRIVLRDDIPVPEPGPCEILIKLECTGIWYLSFIS